ncbi:ICOS ligand-like [Erpetoichthys calabaricus]|uniref:ICOS ligand-like n=1 Tax=Erpetoichthys calabaricus TaxID=27687 RepID=UPI00223445F7|nr:ICOS ligand-like [Erpetoichthys calabaricus]
MGASVQQKIKRATSAQNAFSPRVTEIHREQRSAQARHGEMSHIWRELCLLLLSLSHTQGFPADKCLIASVGETIQLPCSLKTEEPLNIENISLEWTAGDLTLFCLRSYECRVNYFQPKSNFFISEIPHGNFSLRLFSVSLYDERSYSCYYRAAGEHHKRLVCEHCLHVGDRFSDPVLLGPTSPVLNGTEVNFTCKSDEGFPVPWVQWFVNKKPFQDKS